MQVENQSLRDGVKCRALSFGLVVVPREKSSRSFDQTIPVMSRAISDPA
jgi:hypothetical protein